MNVTQLFATNLRELERSAMTEYTRRIEEAEKSYARLLDMRRDRSADHIQLNSDALRLIADLISLVRELNQPTPR